MLTGTFAQQIKQIKPKRGCTKFECEEGHITNYLIGVGTWRSPYRCPLCAGEPATIRQRLEKTK